MIWKKGTMLAEKLEEKLEETIVMPLYKREDRDKKIIGNYRGISLLCTAYKIYAEVEK